MKKKKIMGIFAHPDDDTFGPGATFAKYLRLGHDIHIVTATSGQAGQAAGLVIKTVLEEIRKKEIKAAFDILGIKSFTLLPFYDGTLNESQIPVLQHFIVREVDKFKPDIIIVFDRNGISLHLDHIAVTKSVITLYDHGKIKPKKIYYYGFPVQFMRFFGREGGLANENQAVIDVGDVFDVKVAAMKAHRSQMKDWKRILERLDIAKKKGLDFWKYDYFQLARTSIKGLKYPENDLLSGL